jgi:UV DNA damage endonuclease
MSHRIGYACINTELQDKGVQTSRGMIRRTFDAKGIAYASELALQNVTDLKKILEWNARNDINVFRITSCLVPWASEFELDQMPDYEEISATLGSCGSFAVESAQRLSFHPGPFNCLSSDSTRVVQNTIRDLRIHGEISDMIGLPRSPMSKINVHLGGRFGDGDRAINNFARSFELLPVSVQTRLTLENDDRPNLFSTRDLMQAHKLTGVPIVHDFHHHGFCDGGWSQEEALDAAMSTWPAGIRPVTHYSESAASVEGKPGMRPNAHSDYVYSKIPFPNRQIDVVIEAKAKEKAVFRYRAESEMT